MIIHVWSHAQAENTSTVRSVKIVPRTAQLLHAQGQTNAPNVLNHILDWMANAMSHVVRALKIWLHLQITSAYNDMKVATPAQAQAKMHAPHV